MKKTKTGHYSYTLDELEAFGFDEFQQIALFGNTIKEMREKSK